MVREVVVLMIDIDTALHCAALGSGRLASMHILCIAASALCVVLILSEDARTKPNMKMGFLQGLGTL